MYVIENALFACEQSKHLKLVVLFDSGLYKEDRPQYTAENPYYNKHDWFSYCFEPINQTSKSLTYWKKWIDSAAGLTPLLAKEINNAAALSKVKVFDFYSLKSMEKAFPSRYSSFSRIWKQYFKPRPHVKKMVEAFKQKHDFALKI